MRGGSLVKAVHGTKLQQRMMSTRHGQGMALSSPMGGFQSYGPQNATGDCSELDRRRIHRPVVFTPHNYPFHAVTQGISKEWPSDSIGATKSELGAKKATKIKTEPKMRPRTKDINIKNQGEDAITNSKLQNALIEKLEIFF
jgi:hypothetical protein